MERLQNGCLYFTVLTEEHTKLKKSFLVIGSAIAIIGLIGATLCFLAHKGCLQGPMHPYFIQIPRLAAYLTVMGSIGVLLLNAGIVSHYIWFNSWFKSQQYSDCPVPQEWLEASIDEKFLPKTEFEFNECGASEEHYEVYFLFTCTKSYYFKTEEARKAYFNYRCSNYLRTDDIQTEIKNKKIDPLCANDGDYYKETKQAGNQTYFSLFYRKDSVLQRKHFLTTDARASFISKNNLLNEKKRS